MTDVLIRGLSDEAVARIDATAKAQGLSRNEYLRREFERDTSPKPDFFFSVIDLQRAGEATSDLLDDELMEQAWR